MIFIYQDSQQVYNYSVGLLMCLIFVDLLYEHVTMESLLVMFPLVHIIMVRFVYVNSLAIYKGLSLEPGNLLSL